MGDLPVRYVDELEIREIWLQCLIHFRTLGVKLHYFAEKCEPIGHDFLEPGSTTNVESVYTDTLEQVGSVHYYYEPTTGIRNNYKDPLQVTFKGVDYRRRKRSR